MGKLILFLIFQILICGSLSQKLRVNNGFVNPMQRAFDELIEIHHLNETISSGIGQYMREFTPERLLIELNKSKNIDKTEGDQTSAVNDTCEAQFSAFVNGLMKFELWALNMMDSSSKVPSGILIGNSKDLGQYDECLSIDEFKEEVGLIRGRHCMYSVYLIQPYAAMPITQQLSICVPSTCGAEDIKGRLQSAINQVAGSLPVTVAIGAVQCSEIDSAPYETGEIVTITLFSLFLCFLIGCTAMDIFIRITAGSASNNTLVNLCAFSFYTNLVKIFNTTAPKGSIGVLEGIRFYSLCWVILGHEYMIQLFGAVVNMFDIMEWLSSWSGTFIFSAPFAVDTFFVLSGFLTSYLFMKEMSKGRSFNILLYYLHRYIRLTPAMGALILISIYLVPRWGSGPLWQSMMNGHAEACRDSWWRMLLYSQNYASDMQTGCLSHTWYLAVDMNLFWISPLIIYPLAKKPKVGLLIITGFIIASIISPAVIVGVNEYPSAFGPTMVKNLVKMQDMMKNLYTATHARAGAWLLGVLLGYILSLKPNPKTGLITIGWLLTVIAFAFSFFAIRIFQNDTYEWLAAWEIFYAAVSRHIWAFGICWLIYSSVVGYGGIISNILSWPVYLPFTRISYSVYLVSMLIQMAKSSSQRASFYFSDGTVIYSFFAEMIFCILGGLALSLVFESPFLALERIIFRRPERGQNQQRQEDDQGISNAGYDEEHPRDVQDIVKQPYV